MLSIGRQKTEQMTHLALDLIQLTWRPSKLRLIYNFDRNSLSSLCIKCISDTGTNQAKQLAGGEGVKESSKLGCPCLHGSKLSTSPSSKFEVNTRCEQQKAVHEPSSSTCAENFSEEVFANSHALCRRRHRTTSRLRGTLDSRQGKRLQLGSHGDCSEGSSAERSDLS